MKKAILKRNMFCLNKNKDLIEVYTLDEIRNYPNINEKSFTELQNIKNQDIVGFVKSINYSNNKPDFIQVYESEVEFIREDKMNNSYLKNIELIKEKMLKLLENKIDGSKKEIEYCENIIEQLEDI